MLIGLAVVLTAGQQTLPNAIHEEHRNRKDLAGVGVFVYVP